MRDRLGDGGTGPPARLRRHSVRCARALVVVAALGAAAARAQVPEPRLSAIPEYATVAPGGTVRVAVRIEVPAGWHIDWTNPGEAGLPTTLAWRTPAGVIAGATLWPFPRRLEDASGVSHVLDGVVYAVTPLVASPGVRAGRAELVAELTWLLCSTNCVRQSGTVRAAVRVEGATGAQAAPGARSREWAPVEAASGAFPAAGAGLALHAVESEDSVRLEIAGLVGAPPAGSLVTWFPAAPGRAALVVPLRSARGLVAIVVPRLHVTDAPPRRLSGVLVGLLIRNGAVTSRALAVGATVEPAAR